MHKVELAIWAKGMDKLGRRDFGLGTTSALLSIVFGWIFSYVLFVTDFTHHAHRPSPPTRARFTPIHSDFSSFSTYVTTITKLKRGFVWSLMLPKPI